MVMRIKHNNKRTMNECPGKGGEGGGGDSPWGSGRRWGDVSPEVASTAEARPEVTAKLDRHRESLKAAIGLAEWPGTSRIG